MLQTIHKPPQESEALRRLREFDPAASGWFFWPILFGVVVILGQLAITIR